MTSTQHKDTFVYITLMQQLPVSAWYCCCLVQPQHAAPGWRQQLVRSWDDVQCGYQQGASGQLQGVVLPRGSAPP